jgi:hypothetical protein
MKYSLIGLIRSDYYTAPVYNIKVCYDIGLHVQYILQKWNPTKYLPIYSADVKNSHVFMPWYRRDCYLLLSHIHSRGSYAKVRGRVKRPQMDIKRKTCDIRTWKKQLFLDISSTNIGTLVPSLYQWVETRSIEVFWLLSQPLPHLRFNLFLIRETSANQLWTASLNKHFPS